MRKMTYRNMNELQPHEISKKMWLNIDEVIKAIAISREKLWILVKNGNIEKPYSYKRSALWPSDEIQEFIQQCKKETIDLSKPSQDETPITWDMVVDILTSNGNMTNRNITDELNSNIMDVSSLTRIMTKSGIIGHFYATKDKRIKSFFINVEK